jgi:putative hemolysin
LIIDILLLLSVIGASAFFSFSETAFTCANKYRITGLVNKHPSLKRILNHPDRYIATCLTGNNLVAILASILMVQITSKVLPGRLITVYSTAILTLLITLFGEIIPKEYARYNPTNKVRIVSRFIWFLYLVFFPIIYLVRLPSYLFINRNESNLFNRHDLDILFSKTDWLATINPSEAKTIKQILGFYNRPVKSVMIPRTQIIAIEANATVLDATALCSKHNYSRFPVYDTDLDKILGYYHIIDILIMRDCGLVTLDKTKLRKIVFLPSSRHLKDAMRDLQKSNTHLAIVMDEYGGSAGLVTLEDIIEELFGDVFDEFDTVNENFYKAKSKLFTFHGNTEIHQMNHLHGLSLPASERYHTLAGFLMDISGKVLEEDDVIEFRQYYFKILRKKAQQIQKVLLHIKSAK